MTLPRKFQFVLDDPENLQKFDLIKSHCRLSDDKEVIALALKRLFDEYEIPKKVTALPSYKQRVKGLTGNSGPYLVEDLRHSSLGLSKGLYKLQGCEALLPVDWFYPNKKGTKYKKLLVFLLMLVLSCACYWMIPNVKALLHEIPARSSK